MRHPQRLSVPIRLVPDPSGSLQDQLVEQLRRAIGAGQLAPGTRLPSTRGLGDILQVSRGVVVGAYEVLVAEGHLTGRIGSGTYVAEGPEEVPRSTATRQGHLFIDLRPGRPSPHRFPLSAWRAAWRRASHHPPPLGDLPPLGLPELRQAIAAHVRESRGLVLDHHEVVIAAGYGHALRLVLRAVREEPLVVGLEDPAPPVMRTGLGRRDLVLPLPVDGSGARVDLIPDGCDVVAVMPERNNPLGARMSLERREALAGWAAEGGLVIEPAFDDLFDAHVNPRPSILALADPSATAMVGEFGSTLTPTLRLAYLIAPRRLARRIEVCRSNDYVQPSLLCQQAVADLLLSGCVTRRIDRLAGWYTSRRALVRTSLGSLPGTSLLGADTGSAAALVLPDAGSAKAILRSLADQHVRVSDLASYHHPDSVPGNGIVFGHGHVDDRTLRTALRIIVSAVSDAYKPRTATT